MSDYHKGVTRGLTMAAAMLSTCADDVGEIRRARSLLGVLIEESERMTEEMTPKKVTR